MGVVNNNLFMVKYDAKIINYRAEYITSAYRLKMPITCKPPRYNGCKHA